MCKVLRWFTVKETLALKNAGDVACLGGSQTAWRGDGRACECMTPCGHGRSPLPGKPGQPCHDGNAQKNI